MTSPDFLQSLIKTIETDIARGGGPIAADTELLLDGIVDSLGLVRLVAWVEEYAGVQIDPMDLVLENFSSPKVIAEFVSGLSA